ncbi:hypothetical protein JQ629_02420 [Bradyrhizobium sp. AUGA SZCCT0222]|uniref:hypothetical protein n=1 Tax=Bradyrhizobium sp. AUGA SZCCT0222 TaxID=2807668 RepID=UPI001BAC7BC3|nr:hypothetical protein [Bradyrhizobium sp. AUGA SZCCT0222]MBR1266354.1 hypothetical protein [Bradyrhizobium sp. AUGA SZCCT0222]
MADATGACRHLAGGIIIHGNAIVYCMGLLRGSLPQIGHGMRLPYDRSGQKFKRAGDDAAAFGE